MTYRKRGGGDLVVAEVSLSAVIGAFRPEKVHDPRTEGLLEEVG